MKEKELEWVEVELEEELLAPKPTYAPAIIDAKAYMEHTRARVDSYMGMYADLDDAALASMSLKDARKYRADVNAIIKDVEAQRKAIKAAYMKPYEAFEQAVKATLDEARAVERRLKEVVDKATEAKRQERLERLQAAYEDFAPALVPVVPIERLMDPSWLNASTSEKKAEDALLAKVAKVASDWEALKALCNGDPFAEETEAEFFRTLDISAASAYRTMRIEEQARIDELKAFVEPAQDEPVYEEPVYEEPVHEEAQEPAQDVAQQPAQMTLRRRYRFEACLTDAELASLKEWKTALAIGEGWRVMEVADA